MKATFDLIRKYGAEKTSIAEISKHARVSPSPYIIILAKKEELIRMTFIDYMSNIMNEYEKALDKPLPFQEKLSCCWGHE